MKKLKIGGHKFKVVLRDYDDSTSCGETNYEEGIIYLNKCLPKTMLTATIIHEAMHVMNTTLEHQLLDSLSEQLFQFLHDNNMLK